jgi:hypothetical protein
MTDPREPAPLDQASAPPPPPPPFEWSGPPAFLSTPVPTPAPPRSSRWRWIIALLVTLVVAVAAVGIAVFAQTSRSSASIGPTFLPANTVAYADARIDLPGNQRDKVVAFLSHFPGFADQANFDLKLDKTFDTWAGDVSKGQLTYTAQVKPWFSGQVAVGLLQVPAMAGTEPRTLPRVVVGFGVKDRAKLDSTISTVETMAGSATGATFSEEDYNGTALVTVKTGKGTVFFAVTDTVFLIAADASDLKQSIDFLATPAGSLAKDPVFSKAVTQLPADRLGTMYIGASGFAGLMAQGQSANPLPQCFNTTGLSNSSEVGALVAQADNVSLEFRVSSGSPGARLSDPDDLAARMPADTEVYLAVPGIGKTAHDLIACAKTQMASAIPEAQLQQVEAALGSKLEDYLDFLGDVAVGGSWDGTKVHAGIVGTVADEAKAASRVEKLLTVARLAATAGGVPITSTDTKVGTITVTTIDFGKVPGLPSGLPVDTSLSVAVGGGHFYLGTGDFAAAAAGRQKADSLAATPRYTSALSATGAASGATFYLDVAGLKGQIESAMANQDYTTNTKPYLDPLDRLITVSTPTDDGTSVRVALFVK